MKLKRYLSLLMALCMALTLLPVGTLATEAEPELVDGYYEIYTADQLYWFADQVNSGSTDINGRLMADICVNENVLQNYDGTNGGDFRLWIPIGSADSPYQGVFDGGWFCVSGLYLNDESASGVGLFGCVGQWGQVWNLYVQDSFLVGGCEMGVVAGQNHGSIYNSSVWYCEIFGGNAVGGVAGRNDGGVISCHNYDTTIYGEYFVGGIVGLSEAGGAVRDCTSYGNVVATDDNSYVGGIVGWATDSEISGCENNSYVTGQYGVGGIAGHSYESWITNCRNGGSIYGEGDATGGIVGCNEYGTIENCFNEGVVDITQKQVEGNITIWLELDCDFTPYIWAWDEEYNAVFDQWPGEAMERDGDLWKIQVPADTTGLVISNAGAEQSPDIEINGYQDCVISVPVGFSEYTVTYDSPGEDTSETDNITVWVDMASDAVPYAYAWNDNFDSVLGGWPGTPMEGDGDLWKIQVPLGTTYILFNDGESLLSSDIRMDGDKDCFITVFEDSSEVMVSYGGFGEGDAPETEEITVWLDMDYNFTPYAWVWGDYGNAFGQWPGVPMERDGDLWKIQVPAGSTGFVVSNAGAEQSLDIEINGYQDCVIRIPLDFSEYTITYNSYGGGVTPSEDTITVWAALDWDDTLYACAWGLYGEAFDSWPGVPMEKVGDLWKIEVPTGTTGILFNDGENLLTYDIMIDGYMDCLITVSEDNTEVTVSYEGFEENDPQTAGVTLWVDMDCDFAPYAWAWGLYGDAFDSWPGVPMEKVGDLWKIEVPVGSTGFIVNDGDSQQTWDIMIDGYMDCLITVSEDFSDFAVSYDGFEREYQRPAAGGAIAGINDGTVTNCYYSWNENPLSNSVGTPKTNMECASGEVAYLLQGQQEQQIWGQDLSWEIMPSLYGSKVMPVYDDDDNIVGYQNEVIPAIRGTVTSYLTNGQVTIELIWEGVVIDTAIVSGMNAEFEFSWVDSGTYTLRFSKVNHPAREYEVTVEDGDAYVQAQLCPYGDVTGDGNVNIKDYQRLLRHVNRTNPLTGYALECGDVTGDGNANIKDYQRLLRHVNKTNPLYPETKNVTISVWAPAEDLGYGHGWLAEMQEQFAQAHPEYNITWENEAMSQGDVGYMVLNDPQSAADVFLYPSDMLVRMVEGGALASLTDGYAQQVRNDNFQMQIDSVTYSDGQLYGFPMEGNTWFLYYDRTVYTEEDVTNLDIMLEKGRVSLPYDNGWTAGAFFLGCGCTLFGENGLDQDAGIDFSGNSGGYLAAEKMIQLAQHPNASFGSLNAYALLQGEVDAVFSGSWDAEWLRQEMGDRLGIAMLPKFTIDGEDYQMTAMSGMQSVAGVNPNADELELCMEFAAFLASEEGQLRRYEMNGAIPTHRALAQKALIQSDPVAMAKINTMRYASVLQPAWAEMTLYWTPIQTFATKIANGVINLDNYEKAVNQLSASFATD